MEGKTVVAIAHRLSTIAAMDRLVVMDQGRIVEVGDHHRCCMPGRALCRTRLWSHQSGGFLGEDVEAGRRNSRPSPVGSPVPRPRGTTQRPAGPGRVGARPAGGRPGGGQRRVRCPAPVRSTPSPEARRLAAPGAGRTVALLRGRSAPWAVQAPRRSAPPRPAANRGRPNALRSCSDGCPHGAKGRPEASVHRSRVPRRRARRRSRG
jgi:hypothetical protein